MKMDEKTVALFSLVFSKLFILRTLVASPPVLQVIQIGFFFFAQLAVVFPPKVKSRREGRRLPCLLIKNIVQVPSSF